MSTAEKVENIFQEIPFDDLNDIVMSSDFRVGSYKILEEDDLLCNNLASENIEIKIKNLFELWIEDEISKQIAIKKVIDKCRSQKVILLLDKDASINLSCEYIDIEKFVTFKKFTHAMYSILIIEEVWGYSYFEIVNFQNKSYVWRDIN